MQWLSRFFKEPRGIGSVAPSSPFLGKLMAEHVSPDARVLEIGPGDGAITVFLLRRLRDPKQLRLVEINADLAEECRKKFSGVEVTIGDAELFLDEHADAYDAIVSGIPFAIMEKEKRVRLFRKIRERLAPGGSFTLFQYSRVLQKEIEDVFGDVEIEFTPWNLPPAFVFVAKK